MSRRVAASLLLALAAAWGRADLPAGPGSLRPHEVSAQGSLTQWQTYATGDEVLSLAVGQDGSLWAGTEGGGLVVWNSALTAFQQHVFPDEAGLASNDVRDVALEPDGSAWLATAAGVTHATATGSWRTFDVADGLPSADVLAVAVAPDGSVWAGTYDGGAAVLEPGASDWTPYPPVEFVAGDDALQDGPGDAECSAIAVSQDGRVWVAHGRTSVNGQPALSIYDPSEGAWRFISAIEPGTDPTTGPVTDQVLAIALGPAGVWLGTWSKGVLLYDEDAATWTRYTQADGLCGDNVWSLAADGQNLWAACQEGGAAEWDGADWTPWPLLGQASTFELDTNTVRAVAAAGGDAYLGLAGPGDLGSGILTIAGNTLLEPLTTAPISPWANDITAIAFEPGGTMWVGTRGDGLMRYDGTTWDHYTQSSTDGDLPGDTVTSLAYRDGEMWVATTKSVYGITSYLDGGVAAIDVGTFRWTRLLRSENSELPDNGVSSLDVTPDGRLWIGMGVATGGPGNVSAAQTGAGVAVYDPDTDRFEAFYNYRGAGVELAGPTVLDLASSGSDLWAASSYSELGDPARKTGGGVSLHTGSSWESWAGGQDGLVTFHGSGVATDQDPYITGDIRSVLASGAHAWAGTWTLDAGDLTSVWPYVDAVVDDYEAGSWVSEVFAGQGWVAALAQDSAGRIWAGTTRGHVPQEVDLLTRRRTDTAGGGVELWNGSTWTDLAPTNSGLAGNAITALGVDPTTGYVWVGTENNGLSVYQQGEPLATSTPCENCPTPTPRPAASSTVPLIVTQPATAGAGTRTATTITGLPTLTPLPGPTPPPEVPEPSTLVLLGAGLAAVAAYVGWRRRSPAR